MNRNRQEKSDSDNDEVYDAIDKFHHEKDNELLKDFNKKKPRGGTEEVLGVYESDSELTDSSEDSIVEEETKRQGNDVGLSADAWGKSRSEFYGTLADEDYGNWDEERDEELELEEEDAIRRQKKLDAGLSNVDFAALLESDEEDVATKKQTIFEEPSDKKTNKVGTVEYFLKYSPNMAGLFEEYNQRKKSFSKLKPILSEILESMKNVDYDDGLVTQVKLILSTYSQYLRNLSMFFFIKGKAPVDKFKATENHPILDDIMKIHPIMSKVDSFLKTGLPLLKKVAGKLRQDPEYSGNSRVVAKRKFVKKSAVAARQTTTVNVDEEEEMEVDDEKGQAKRRITYEMQKNRGLTVKRKKGTTHSRIKKRVQYKKALQRRRSQVPDVRTEVNKYDGEKRGIRASTVRSIKLKA